MLSCDIRQYLSAYLDKGYLELQPDPKKPLIQVAAKHAALFGDSFVDGINHQVDRFLSYHFSAEIVKRNQQLTLVDLKAILKTRNLTLSKGKNTQNS